MTHRRSPSRSLVAAACALALAAAVSAPLGCAPGPAPVGETGYWAAFARTGTPRGAGLPG